MQFLTDLFISLSAIREDGMPGGRNKMIGPVQVRPLCTVVCAYTWL